MEPFGLSMIRRRMKRQMHLLLTVVVVINVMTIMHMVQLNLGVSFHTISRFQYLKRDKKRRRVENLNSLIRESDVACKNDLRMNRKTFFVLCEMLRDIRGLTGSRNMPLEEILALFLYTLAHHKKNRSVAGFFERSGESVSRQFNLCLLAVLKLHHHLLQKPTPISEDCEDSRWKCFKNCLGALGGTFLSVRVKNEDRSRYRTRKGNLAMNVLGVCSPNMEFIFIMPGWEGPAHDGRVLRDAISNPNGLKVPQGCYYLVDAGYTNCQGFLAPYRGHRYHLKEWGDRQPDGKWSSQLSQFGRGKNKRFWKKEEEEALINALVDLSVDPSWKGEGGFKNGYMVKLEGMIDEKCPGCGIRAMPHIDSKIKWFKDKYGVINDMLNLKSGFKWDDERKIITSTLQSCRIMANSFPTP